MLTTGWLTLKWMKLFLRHFRRKNAFRSHTVCLMLRFWHENLLLPFLNHRWSHEWFTISKCIFFLIAVRNPHSLLTRTLAKLLNGAGFQSFQSNSLIMHFFNRVRRCDVISLCYKKFEKKRKKKRKKENTKKKISSACDHSKKNWCWHDFCFVYLEIYLIEWLQRRRVLEHAQPNYLRPNFPFISVIWFAFVFGDDFLNEIRMFHIIYIEYLFCRETLLQCFTVDRMREWTWTFFLNVYIICGYIYLVHVCHNQFV